MLVADVADKGNGIRQGVSAEGEETASKNGLNGRLAKALEPMIRKIVREELGRMVATKPSGFYLEPGSPLYEDMEPILHETQGQKAKLLSRAEALRG